MNIEAQIWQEGWQPTTDTEVTHILKYLAEKQREKDRITKSAHEEIQFLEDIGKKAEESFRKIENRVTQILERYVLEEIDEDDRKETTTTYKYKLARGEIIVNKETRKIEKPSSKNDEEALISNYPDYVSKEPKFNWSEFKKDLELTEDGQVVQKKTGIAVNNVPVVQVPRKTVVKLNNK